MLLNPLAYRRHLLLLLVMIPSAVCDIWLLAGARVHGIVGTAVAFRTFAAFAPATTVAAAATASATPAAPFGPTTISIRADSSRGVLIDVIVVFRKTNFTRIARDSVRIRRGAMIAPRATLAALPVRLAVCCLRGLVTALAALAAPAAA